MAKAQRKKVNLILGIHCHQPVGNFPKIFKKSYEKAYRPFIDVLSEHPRIKATLHYSGSLLDWTVKERPEFLDRLKELVRRGQIEILGGGYYEPILSLIPDEDKTGQIELFNEAVFRHTGYKPAGLWLTERVWEPGLASFLQERGVKYTIVDEHHFELAGLAGKNIFGYFVTEDKGKSIFVFPNSQKLRYSMPFRLPGESIRYLKKIATPDGKRLTVIIDDGEKFGLWPGTYRWVYGRKWLEKFFSSLEANSDWIKTTTFNEFLEDFSPLGRVYLPTASYPAMMRWSGGFFRNFLTRYSESNNMHKKMLLVSEKLTSLGLSGNAVDERKLKQARLKLYKGQCNCAYWHGVFGGIYLTHLRQAIYNNLIEAEKLADELLFQGKTRLRAQLFDFDRDGKAEVLLNNSVLGLYFDTETGGLFELDYKPAAVNLINTLTRRPEHYHRKLNKRGLEKNKKGGGVIHRLVGVKESGLKNLLRYDTYRKISFLDHFLKPQAKLNDFVNAALAGIDGSVPARYKEELNKGADSFSLKFTRDGRVKTVKSFFLEKESPDLNFNYRLSNQENERIRTSFGIEFNLSLRNPAFASRGKVVPSTVFRIDDEEQGICVEFNFDKEAALWYFPLQTVSESERGLEKTYQGLSLLFLWPISLGQEENWSLEGKLIIRQNGNRSRGGDNKDLPLFVKGD